MRRLAPLVLLALGCQHPTADSPMHVLSREETRQTPLSLDVMAERLDVAAHRYRENAPVPRIALFDFTLPLDMEEYDALNGWAVVVITLVTQDPLEIPPKRAYGRLRGEVFDLALLAHRSTTTMDQPDVAQVLGRYRFDGLYLIPMAFRALGTELVVDFARNRDGFVVSTAPMEPEPDGFPVALPTAAGPRTDALNALVAREVSLFAPVEIHAGDSSRPDPDR